VSAVRKFEFAASLQGQSGAVVFDVLGEHIHELDLVREGDHQVKAGGVEGHG
jgi:hypothetical protein